MKQFRCLWNEQVVYEIIIKAKNEDEAEDKFKNGNYNHKKIREIGGEMVENSLEIEEIEE